MRLIQMLSVISAIIAVKCSHTEKNQNLRELIEEFDLPGVMPRILIPEKESGHSSVEVSESATIRVIAEIRNAFETFWFRSVIVLVEDSEEILNQAKSYVKELISSSYGLPTVSLMKFNSTGVSPILANTSDVEQFFSNLIVDKNLNLVRILESERKNVLFYAILTSIRKSAVNSAILVFTDRGTQDEDLAQLACKELVENQIRLYVIWSGIYPALKNEEKLLKQTAILSGGKFFISNSIKNLSQLYNSAYIRNSETELPKSLVALKVNITTKDYLTFSMDSSVECIHISVTSPVDTLELISPQGFVLDLLNEKAVERFSKGSFVMSQLQQYDVQLNTVGHLQKSISGLWRLGIRPTGLNPQGCNVTVSAQTHLNVTAYVAEQFDESQESSKKVVRITIPNEISSVNQVSLFDKWGSPINNNISFKTDRVKNQKYSDNLKDALVNPKFDVEFTDIPNESFYVTVRGKYEDGIDFTRTSYLEREKVTYLTKPLAVEVTADSELIVRPNQEASIYFEVTNNQDQVVIVTFKCEDEKRMLVDMRPRSSWLNPMQTSIVTVYIKAPNTVTADYRNLMTFTASGNERVQKFVQVYVTNSVITDNEEPRLTHRYTSDCTNVLLGDCRDRTWTIEVTAQDRDSGLLQLTSTPRGLYFPNDYVPGTRESVVGIYAGSCCKAKIQITAVDLVNNRRTYTTDAYRAALSAGSISAIVLGVFLFIIIVIVIVIVVRKMCFKQKISVDLPVYSSPHGNTRER